MSLSSAMSGTFSMSTAAGWAIVTISRKDRHRSGAPPMGQRRPLQDAVPDLAASGSGERLAGRSTSQQLTPASLMSCATRATHRWPVAEIPAAG